MPIVHHSTTYSITAPHTSHGLQSGLAFSNIHQAGLVHQCTTATETAGAAVLDVALLIAVSINIYLSMYISFFLPAFLPSFLLSFFLPSYLRYIYVCVCMCVCDMYIYIYVYVCVCICIHIYIYKHIYYIYIMRYAFKSNVFDPFGCCTWLATVSTCLACGLTNSYRETCVDLACSWPCMPPRRVEEPSEPDSPG